MDNSPVKCMTPMAVEEALEGAGVGDWLLTIVMVVVGWEAIYLHQAMSAIDAMSQVFDLGEEAPDKVLQRLYGNLERLKSNGDYAAKIERTLRLIVVGGDGTSSWLLGVVCEASMLNKTGWNQVGTIIGGPTFLIEEALLTGPT